MDTNVFELAKSIADHASAQSDRWLFLFTLAIGLTISIWMVRYLVKDLESTRTRHLADREASKNEIKQVRDLYQESMESLIKQEHEMAKQIAVILDKNTEALRLCTEELRHMREEARNLA